MKTVTCPGNDPRMALTAEYLKEDGFILLPEGEADLTLCPPGWGGDDLLREAAKVSPGGVLVAGRIPPETAALCRDRGVRAVALLENESYRLANARATAEGTLGEAIRLLPRVLLGETVLILGYGFCGREAARLFGAVGCRILVWSHPGSLKKALADGFESLSTALLPTVSVAVNTVPAPDFLPDLLPRFAPGCLFLQIASGEPPEREAMERRGISCHALPGLPGKFAPETEARAVLGLVRANL